MAALDYALLTIWALCDRVMRPVSTSESIAGLGCLRNLQHLYMGANSSSSKSSLASSCKKASGERPAELAGLPAPCSSWLPPAGEDEGTGAFSGNSRPSEGCRCPLDKCRRACCAGPGG